MISPVDKVGTPLTLPSGMTLAELNHKYHTCSTCRFCTMLQTGRGKKTGHLAWCELHNRPVEYEYFTGPKGQKWVATDIPRDEYVYYRSLFLSKNLGQ